MEVSTTATDHGFSQASQTNTLEQFALHGVSLT